MPREKKVAPDRAMETKLTLEQCAMFDRDALKNMLAEARRRMAGCAEALDGSFTDRELNAATDMLSATVADLVPLTMDAVQHAQLLSAYNFAIKELNRR